MQTEKDKNEDKNNVQDDLIALLHKGVVEVQQATDEPKAEEKNMSEGKNNVEEQKKK